MIREAHDCCECCEKVPSSGCPNQHVKMCSTHLPGITEGEWFV